jgi:hypothetical protein
MHLHRSEPLTAARGPQRREHAEVVVARRYLGHGFLDAALRIFTRHAGSVTANDWRQLADRLLERGRIAEAVRVCETGHLPLPHAQLLALGDRDLRRKDVDGAIHWYELAEADGARWSALLDLLVRLPGHELQAMQVAERHVVERPVTLRLAAGA